MNEQVISVGKVIGDLIKSQIAKKLTGEPKQPKPRLKELFLDPLADVADQQGFHDVAAEIRAGPFKKIERLASDAYKTFLERVGIESVSENADAGITTEMTPMWLADP